MTILLLTTQLPVQAQNRAKIQQQVKEKISSLPVTVEFDVDYVGNNNIRQMMDLYQPKNPKTESLPAIVMIHGGGWRAGDRTRYASHAVRLASTGNYVVFSLGYRLSEEAKWPAQIHDVKAGIRYIRANAKDYGIDPNRIGTWGSSAGGHLVSLLGTSADVEVLEGNLGPHTGVSSRVRCVVNQCGPQDLTKAIMYKNGKPVKEDPAVALLVEGPLSENPEVLVELSPLTYVTADDAPFLTLHGTKDLRVSYEQAEIIEEALEKAGVESHLISVVEGGHGLSHPELYSIVDQFFAHHLRDVKAEFSDRKLLPQ